MTTIIFSSLALLISGLALGYTFAVRGKIPKWVSDYMFEAMGAQRKQMNDKYEDFKNTHSTIIHDLRLKTSAHQHRLDTIDKDFEIVKIRTNTLEKKIIGASRTVNFNVTGPIPFSITPTQVDNPLDKKKLRK